jgi:hypothetical protein
VTPVAGAAGEVWTPIPGWPHYEISDGGDVRSIDHIDRNGRRWPGKLLKLSTPRPGPRAGGGGARVKLSHGARRATFYPHRELERKATP